MPLKTFVNEIWLQCPTNILDTHSIETKYRSSVSPGLEWLMLPIQPQGYSPTTTSDASTYSGGVLKTKTTYRKLDITVKSLDNKFNAVSQLVILSQYNNTGQHQFLILRDFHSPEWFDRAAGRNYSDRQGLIVPQSLKSGGSFRYFHDRNVAIDGWSFTFEQYYSVEAIAKRTLGV